MRRADRLFQLVQLLRGGRVVTAAQIATSLEVSPRTVYRDIGDLVGSGVPIEGEAGVGYCLPRGFDLPPLMFDEDEIGAQMLDPGRHGSGAGPELERSSTDLSTDALQKPFVVLHEVFARFEGLCVVGLVDSTAHLDCPCVSQDLLPTSNLPIP